jgi:hypothetical protein
MRRARTHSPTEADHHIRRGEFGVAAGVRRRTPAAASTSLSAASETGPKSKTVAEVDRFEGA